MPCIVPTIAVWGVERKIGVIRINHVTEQWLGAQPSVYRKAGQKTRTFARKCKAKKVGGLPKIFPHRHCPQKINDLRRSLEWPQGCFSSRSWTLTCFHVTHLGSSLSTPSHRFCVVFYRIQQQLYCLFSLRSAKPYISWLIIHPYLRLRNRNEWRGQ